MSTAVTPVSTLLGRQHRLALRAVLGLQRAAGEYRLRRLEDGYAADLDDMRRRSAIGEKQPWHSVAMRSAA